jgi:small subunit ribosomal protein S16
MVRIRLARVGAKKQPYYRVVVADQRSPRDGRFIEIIGNYNPRTDPAHVVIKEERALHWLRHGAQPSAAVRRMLVSTGIMDTFLGKPSAPSDEAADGGTAADPESEDAEPAGVADGASDS